MTRLHEIDLAGTQVTDAGLARLKGVGNLHTVRLSPEQITEIGVAGLKQLPKLQALRISQGKARTPH